MDALINLCLSTNRIPELVNEAVRVAMVWLHEKGRATNFD